MFTLFADEEESPLMADVYDVRGLYRILDALDETQARTVLAIIAHGDQQVFLDAVAALMDVKARQARGEP